MDATHHPPPVPASTPSDSFVTFRLGEQTYALPLGHVERALRMVAVTPVPNAPLGVLGVINLAGRLLPMLDVRTILGLPGKTPSVDDRLLVVTAQEHTLALAADEVCDVLALRTTFALPQQPVKGWDAPAHDRLLAATVYHAGEVIFVLDVAPLVSIAESVLPMRERLP